MISYNSALADGDRMQLDRLKRRKFITLLGCATAVAAVAAPLKSFAQQHPGKIPRIGWLVPTTQAEWESLLVA